MIPPASLLTIIAILGFIAANLHAENSSESTKPEPNTPSSADFPSMDVVIFSGESVVDYTTKKYALVDSTLPPPNGSKSTRLEFWKSPHTIVIGAGRGANEFSPAQIDWSTQDLVFDYRTEGVPKILSLSIFILVGGALKEALVLKNSPDLMGLEIDGRWHTAIVDVEDWQTPFKVALASGKIPKDALVNARIGFKVAHNGAINISNLRAISKDPKPKSSGISEPAPTPEPTPTAKPAASAPENSALSPKLNDAALSRSLPANLPPSAYEKLQANASDHLEIQILLTEINPTEESGVFLVHASGHVEKVHRSQSGTKEGDVISITYSVKESPTGQPARGEIPFLAEGEVRVAYLENSGKPFEFRPAAAAMSFDNF